MRHLSAFLRGRSAVRHMTWFIVGIVAFTHIASTSAEAYVGPGAGITLFSALWAVILAVVLALAGLFIWPVRAFLKRRKVASGTGNVASEEQTNRDQAP